MSTLFFYFIILIKNIKYINSFEGNEKPNYLKFKIETKIKSISKKKYNFTYNETNFINEFLDNKIFININMGTPPQNVKILLDPNDICFTFNHNKELIKYNNKYPNNINYTQLSPYNKRNSSSAKKGKVTYFDKEFDYLYDMEEVFYLYQYNDFKNKTNDISNSTTLLRFLYGNYKNEEEIVYGKIGLNMNSYEDISCPRFIYSLHINYIINKFIWYFDFQSRFNGYFYIGPEPHLYNKDDKIYKDFQYIKMNTILSKEGYVDWKILFNKINVYNSTNKYISVLNDKYVQIDFNLGLIIGTYEYQNIIEENYFNLLISKNFCKKSLIEYSYNNKEKSKYFIYSCKNSFLKSIYEFIHISYYDLFPKIEFIHIDLENNFKLNKYDLFEQINGDYYFLIIFNANVKNDIWKLGQPFLKKYPLIFDYKSKIIGYYDKNILSKKKEKDYDSEESNNKKQEQEENANNLTKNNPYKNSSNLKDNIIINNIVTYFILIVFFCSAIIASFYFGMKIKDSRRKRANELKEDYEYLSYNNNISTNTKYKQKIELNRMGL